MKAGVGREKYLGIALATISLLLLGLLFWELNQGMRLEQELLKLRKIPVVAAKPLKVMPEFSLPPEESAFPELVSHSLFSVTRRSNAVAVKGGASAMKKGQFVLVGVIITPKQRSAQLRDVQTNKAETVALNGLVRGMTVGEIEASRVVLRQGAETEELTLNVLTGPKGAAVAKLPAPTPPAPPTVEPVVPLPAQSASAASAPARAASGVAPPASAPRPTGKPADPPPATPVQPIPPQRAEAKK